MHISFLTLPRDIRRKLEQGKFHEISAWRQKSVSPPNANIKGEMKNHQPRPVVVAVVPDVGHWGHAVVGGKNIGPAADSMGYSRSSWKAGAAAAAERQNSFFISTRSSQQQLLLLLLSRLLRPRPAHPANASVAAAAIAGHTRSAARTRRRRNKRRSRRGLNTKETEKRSLSWRRRRESLKCSSHNIPLFYR